MKRQNISPIRPSSSIANPAAVYAVQQGYGYQIVTDPDGSQHGVVTLPSGEQREEWELFRETHPISPSPSPGRKIFSTGRNMPFITKEKIDRAKLMQKQKLREFYLPNKAEVEKQYEKIFFHLSTSALKKLSKGKGVRAKVAKQILKWEKTGKEIEKIENNKYQYKEDKLTLF
jgi:putative hemolysin